MKTIRCLALSIVVFTVAGAAAAQRARLYDGDVKSLIEQSRKTADRFWNALDGGLKNSTFKGPSGEFVVKKLFEDYKNTIEAARKRFGPSYSTSTEVARIFEEAVRVDTYVKEQGPAMKGASEWEAHAEVLRRLAGEYGGTFPPTPGGSYRRYTDKEIVSATTAIEASSRQLASALDAALKKDNTVPEASRKAMVADVKRVGDAAKALGSTVKGRRPATAQVTMLLDQARKVRDTLTTSGAAAAVEGHWTRVNQQLGMIAATFHSPF